MARNLNLPGAQAVRIMKRGGCALATVLTLFGTCALAEDASIEGIFTQNQICKGDGSQQVPLRVKMGETEIAYAGGTCSIDSRQQSGPNLTMQVTCKFKSGAVLGSVVTFTRKDDNTFDMSQQDGSYKAVLHRCTG